ncbi:PRC-barrel domain-containing protein [Devosia sp. 2618]|uniref:PRC-barrel domain-containing protein n=1 Tax=Devosia sp. 2618 TaxID=3156454 RepID=UPI00339944E3
MIRTLLATTAIAALMTSGAFAQEATPADPAAPVTTEAPVVEPMAPAVVPPAAPAAGTDVNTGAAQTTEVHTPWDISAGYIAVDTDNLGSHLMGQPVYSSSGEDAEEIGTISDIVFNAEGDITAVVIGVGGFLGIGEKSVAVDFQSLEFTRAADNTERWVVPTTADALTSAPEFVWREDEPVDATAPVDTMAPAPVAPAM